MTPSDPLVARILGADPPAAEAPRVRAHVEVLLAPGERFVAGLDTTWFDTGARGSWPEDINDNFAFDSNWGLADGTIDQPSLTFNRRVEVRFSSDDVAASGVYSRGITYAVEDDRLVRTARRTRPPACWAAA